MTNREQIALKKRFGEKIRQAREQKGWSQSRLSHEAEMDAGWISQVELGKVNPGLIIIITLARALGCRPGELMDEL
jgi:transcriptional regulator with XRE-family HTH domain